MDGKNTFTAVAVLCLLGLIASLITVPAGDGTAAFPWHRPVFVVDQGDAAPAAPSDRLIPLTKRTIANAERITEAVKAGISAAGKVIDRTEVSSEQPPVAQAAIAEAVKAAAPPVPLPTTPDVQRAVGQWGDEIGGVRYLQDQFGQWWSYTQYEGVLPSSGPQASMPAGWSCANGQCFQSGSGQAQMPADGGGLFRGRRGRR